MTTQDETDAATEFAQELVWLFDRTSDVIDVPEEFGRSVANARAYLSRQQEIATPGRPSDWLVKFGRSATPAHMTNASIVEPERFDMSGSTPGVER